MVVLVGVATVAFKAVGPVLVGACELAARLRAVVGLLAPALFAALIVTQTLGGGGGVVVDERVFGVAAAALAVALRAPVLVIVVAAAATALVRAL